MLSNEKTQPEKVKKTTKKTAKKAESDLSGVTSPVTKESSFRFVTSLNLKRSFLSGDIKHCKFIMQENDFRELIMAGMKNKVTWDEILRALVSRELSSNEPFGGIENYL